MNPNQYNFGKYNNIERWSSYWHQINEVLSLRPESVLVIGKGDGIVPEVLKKHIQEVKTMDIDERLEPDIVASAENIPLKENSFEVILCAEVLEHLPFEKFKNSLSEIYRVSKGFVILSLPHWGRHFSIEIRMPFFKKKRLQCKLNFFPVNHKFDGEHYWEIEKKGYSLKKIKKEIESVGLKILKDYICFESPYHHFFILKK